MAVFYNYNDSSNHKNIEPERRCEKCGHILSCTGGTFDAFTNAMIEYKQEYVYSKGERKLCYVCPQCGHYNF